MISLSKLLRGLPASAAAEPPSTLEELIERAVAFLQSQTHRYFGPPRQLTEYLSGNNSRFLKLGERIIGTIATIEEREYPGATPTTLTLNTDYAIRSGETTDYLIRLGNLTWCGTREYAVTYQQGYELDAGPGDIEQLIMDLIALRLSTRGKEGLSSEQIGGYSYSRSGFTEADLAQLPGAIATIEQWRGIVYA